MTPEAQILAPEQSGNADRKRMLFVNFPPILPLFFRKLTFFCAALCLIKLFGKVDPVFGEVITGSDKLDTAANIIENKIRFNIISP